jgi:hypothetical protein
MQDKKILFFLYILKTSMNLLLIFIVFIPI